MVERTDAEDEALLRPLTTLGELYVSSNAVVSTHRSQRIVGNTEIMRWTFTIRPTGVSGTGDVRSDSPFTKRSGDMVSMPWKERSVVEERMRFVLRLKDGESMASLCREFGFSRVTGYKVYDRYKECGLEGLTDRARTPYRYANKLPAQELANLPTLLCNLK
jgi:hypothetical protein